MNRVRVDKVAGQALSESLVAVLFLTPLLLCMVYLIELLRAEQSAEVTVREIALAAVHSPAGSAAPGFVEALQQLTMPADETAGERLDPRITEISSSNPATDVERIARAMLVPAALVGIGRFDMPLMVTHRATTGVSLGSTRDLGVPFDVPVGVQAQLAFVAGHGAALSPDQVRSRTAALSVAGTLAEIAEPIELLATIASPLEPALRRLCIGRIDPEIVPADRLPESVTRSSDLRYRPC